MTQSLWDIALHENKNSKDLCNLIESTILICGSRDAGKSTIINKFIEKDEIPKQTFALDYNFIRKSAKGVSVKSIAHCYELGNDIKLKDLAEASINPKNLRNFNVILVVDLSRPNECWLLIETLLNTIKQRIDKIIDRVSAKDEGQLRRHLEEKTNTVQLEAHPDWQQLCPFPVPLTIFCTKFDYFLRLYMEQRTLLSRALRFLAHYHNASLYFFNTRDDQHLLKAKSIMNKMSFGSGETGTLQTDLQKPLSIQKGSDSLAAIGAPPSTGLSNKLLYESWKAAFNAKFPHNNALETVKALTDEYQFAEPLVDDARRTGEEFLDEFRRQSERRMRDQLQQAASEGVLLA